MNKGYVVCMLATLAFLFGILAMDKFYPADKLVEQEKFNPSEGLFYVVAYRGGSKINNEVLADYVRKDSNKGELVCREWKTGEYYIFPYPVSVYDVTLTKDYIKFTNEK